MMVKKGRKGFATMQTTDVQKISSMGGRIAHERGLAHEFTPEEARDAGRKGGHAVVAKRGREHMQEIGRRGAEARKRRAAAEKAAQEASS